MKDYQSIPKISEEFIGRECIAQRKEDGSNLRFKFTQKKGWHLFGTRNRLFDKNDPEYGCAIDIFLQKYASGVENVIANNKHFRGVREVIAFAEFFGPYSFGGQHAPDNPVVILSGCKGKNDPKDVIMFDINLLKKGILPAKEFNDVFSHLPIAKIVYEGTLDEEFVTDVRAGKYPVVEGVVCKGLIGKAPHGLWSCKIKCTTYLEELKKRFGTGWEKYE